MYIINYYFYSISTFTIYDTSRYALHKMYYFLLLSA